MANVPAEYLLFLFRQPWIKEWPDMHDYLVDNQDALLQEGGASEEGENSRGFDSYDDYMRYGRG